MNNIFESIEYYINNFPEKDLEGFDDYINNLPEKDFDGLSRKQMYDLLYEDWGENSITINPEKKSGDNIPIIKLIKYFLNNISKEEITLTKIGNIPPTIVKSLYNQKLVFDYKIENGLTKLTKETDAKPIVLLRILCELSGLIKKRNNILSITKRGKDYKDSPDLFELIFETFCKKYNWAYFDGFNSIEIGQVASNYTLYLLDKYGDVKRSGDFYGDLYFTAFDFLVIDNEYESSIYCYSSRTFEKFLVYFGFIEIEYRDKENIHIKTTPLFKEYIQIII